jgi:hypothetical protein
MPSGIPDASTIEAYRSLREWMLLSLSDEDLVGQEVRSDSVDEKAIEGVRSNNTDHSVRLDDIGDFRP